MILADPAATESLGAALGAFLSPGDVVLLSGGLGAGKTSLARGILRGAGYTGDVASPTFPILIDYAPPDIRLPVAHADLYRIEDPGELEQLDLDAARFDGALIVEWPERLPAGAWPDALRLNLATDGIGRRLTAKPGAAWEARWPIR
jgi:tRNA threonylcarbamoyladenosine biosynthesis protein TsaE